MRMVKPKPLRGWRRSGWCMMGDRDSKLRDCRLLIIGSLHRRLRPLLPWRGWVREFSPDGPEETPTPDYFGHSPVSTTGVVNVAKSRRQYLLGRRPFPNATGSAFPLLDLEIVAGETPI